MEGKYAMSLMMAVDRGDEKRVESMVEDFKEYISDDNTGNFRPEHTGLPYACRRGIPEIAKLFVEKGASLERACPFNHFSPSSSVQVWATPLHCASKYGYAETVAYLLMEGANVETRVKIPFSDERLETPLELACDGAVLKESERTATCFQREPNHVEVARLLLEAGATVTERLIRKICNPEYEDHNLEMAKVFILHKTKATNADGLTLLHVACAFGSVMAALPLLQEDIDIDAETCCGKTALHLSCEFGHLPIVQVLLNQGADLEAQDEDGWTPLHWASAMGHTEIAEMLIQEGAELEAEQRHGWTAVQLACQNDKLKTVELLVDFGAIIHAGGTSGWTPLHIACKFGCLEVAQFLLDHGCDVNAQNKKDWTPLHAACRFGQLKMARLLLDNRCAWAVKAKGGIVAEDLARKYGHVEVAELVCKHQDMQIFGLA